MLVALLPVLTLAATETITFDSQDELELALAVRVRSALASGWTLADVSLEDDGSGLGFTLTKDGEIERHVAVLEGSNVYRIGPAELPDHPVAPSGRLLEALRGRGGFELVSTCDGYYAQPYVIDGFAVGAEAGALVARSLAAADDLDSAWVKGRRAMFQLEAGGHAIDLIVTLTDAGGVAQVERRRYEGRSDDTMYRRRGAMIHALRHAFVSSIHPDDGGGVVLRTNRGRFAMDPGGTAFRSRHGEDHEGGCGC